MIKRILPLLFFIFLFTGSYAQFDTAFAKINLKRSADSLVKGFKTRNWEQYARYSYPALIGSLGGKDAFIKYIRESFAAIPDSAWKKYESGQVLQVVKTTRDLQAIIELNTVLEWEHLRVTSTHYLIAESWDGGLFWTFFDSQNDPVASTMIKPDLSDQLRIPSKNEKMEPLDKASKKKE